MREANRKYELVLENIPLHIAVIDGTGKFVLWNKYSEKLFDYSRKKAIGRLEPKDLHVSVKEAREVLRTAEEKGIFDGEVKLKTAGGSVLDIHLVVVPYRDVLGRIENYYGFGEDITARKRTKEMLKRSYDELERRVEERTQELQRLNRKLELAMDNLNIAQRVAHTGSWHLEMRGNKLAWSDETYRIFGVEKGTPVDYEKFLGVVHPDDREYVDMSWQSALNKKPYDIEHRILVRGETKWIREQAQVEFDKEGIPLTGIGTVQDISRRKLQEERVRVLREELMHVSRVTTMGEFTAALAHEINQPLMAIMSNAQAARRFMAKEKPDLKEIDEILSDIIKDDKWAGDIIVRLKLLLKKSSAEFTKLDINDVIREVIPIIHSDVVIRNIAVEMRFDDGLPRVNGDRIQLQQVVLNLMLNAFEAMKDSDTRTLFLRTGKAGDGFIEVSVEDSGCGIKEEEVENLFKPFTTTKKDGLGMGLAINRAIIDAHGGILRAVNNPGGGATFSFTLPVNGERK